MRRRTPYATTVPCGACSQPGPRQRPRGCLRRTIWIGASKPCERRRRVCSRRRSPCSQMRPTSPRWQCHVRHARRSPSRAHMVGKAELKYVNWAAASKGSGDEPEPDGAGAVVESVGHIVHAARAAHGGSPGWTSRGKGRGRSAARTPKHKGVPPLVQSRGKGRVRGAAPKVTAERTTAREQLEVGGGSGSGGGGGRFYAAWAEEVLVDKRKLPEGVAPSADYGSSVRSALQLEKCPGCGRQVKACRSGTAGAGPRWSSSWSSLTAWPSQRLAMSSSSNGARINCRSPS